MEYTDRNKALTDHLRILNNKIEKLEGIEKHFKNKTEVETDEFKRTVYDRLSQYPQVISDMFKHIEMISIAYLALETKLEGLRDIIYELQEVKKSPEIQEKIHRLFLDYESKF